jgi:glycosyltransferase involved in cell wall biosynthesis
MENRPMVSVCMITYGHGPFIRQAIEGVLAQECDFPVELVIGEDCGPDETRMICEEMARANPGVIRLLPSTVNMGPRLNFMRTQAACTGKYIAICEGDDYWTDPLKLRKQVGFLEANADYAGTAHQSTVVMEGADLGPFRRDVPDELSTNDLIGGRLFHTSTLLFKREVLALLEGLPTLLSGDRLVNLVISFKGKLHFFQESMGVYRKHPGGLSSTATIPQMLTDLNCASFLKRLHPAFPRYRFVSYVYATIGMHPQAAPTQRLRYMGLSFLYSFSFFPENIVWWVRSLFKRRDRV